MKMMVIPIVTGTLETTPKGTGRVRNHRMSDYHPDYWVITGQNTEKSPEDLRNLAVLLTPVKNMQGIILKKIVKIWGQVNCEEHTQSEPQMNWKNIKNQVTTDARNTSTVTLEDKTNVKLYEWMEDYLTIPRESRLEKS